MEWNLVCLDEVDSTSSEVRRRMEAGADEGLAVLACAQTKGRGRMGRSFSSPSGKGLYLSVLLRPAAAGRELLWLTPWTAVAVMEAIESCCGVRPSIKWVNDLVLGGKKLCGILCERVGESIILGVGVNLTQTAADFGAELAPIATSLLEQTGRAPRREELTRAILAALGRMYVDFPHRQADYLARYGASCITLGKAVRVLHPEGGREGIARGLDDDYGLLVEYPGGESETVTAGEVSVRGLYGGVQ